MMGMGSMGGYMMVPMPYYRGGRGRAFRYVVRKLAIEVLYLMNGMSI